MNRDEAHCRECDRWPSGVCKRHQEINNLRAQVEQLEAALKKAHDEIDRLTGYV